MQSQIAEKTSGVVLLSEPMIFANAVAIIYGVLIVVADLYILFKCILRVSRSLLYHITQPI